MDWAAFKTFTEPYLICLYFREWWKGTTSGQRCVCVCVWLTYYGWYCFGLILTPTPAPLCLLLQAVPSTHTQKKKEVLFLVIIILIRPAHHSPSHTFLLLTRLVDLCGSDTHTSTWHWLPGWQGHGLYSTSWRVGSASCGLILFSLRWLNTQKRLCVHLFAVLRTICTF